MTKLLAGLPTFVLLLAAPAAHADSASWITLGIGSAVSVAHGPSVADGRLALDGDLHLKVRLLEVLAIEAGVSAAGLGPASDGAGPKMHAGVDLYLVSASWIGVYVHGGLEGSPGAALSSMPLTLGPGLEIFIGGHIALGLELSALIKNKGSIADSLLAWVVDQATSSRGFDGADLRASLAFRYYL
jgi:hypothetical protein